MCDRNWKLKQTVLTCAVAGGVCRFAGNSASQKTGHLLASTAVRWPEVVQVLPSHTRTLFRIVFSHTVIKLRTRGGDEQYWERFQAALENDEANLPGGAQ